METDRKAFRQNKLSKLFRFSNITRKRLHRFSLNFYKLIASLVRTTNLKIKSLTLSQSFLYSIKKTKKSIYKFSKNLELYFNYTNNEKVCAHKSYEFTTSLT